MDTPNADYNTLMDANAGKTFPQYYDEWMTTLAENSGINDEIRAQLKAKRDFGLKKYGARAFQSSFENAITSPVGAHLGDELVDAFNYALHGLWVARTSGDVEKASWYEVLLDRLISVTNVLAGLRSFLSEGEQKALAWVGSEIKVVADGDS